MNSGTAWTIADGLDFREIKLPSTAIFVPTFTRLDALNGRQGGPSPPASATLDKPSSPRRGFIFDWLRQGSVFLASGSCVVVLLVTFEQKAAFAFAEFQTKS